MTPPSPAGFFVMKEKMKEKLQQLLREEGCEISALDSIAQAKIENAVTQLENAPHSCVAEKGSTCSSCVVAHLAVALIRWALLPREKALRISGKLCEKRGADNKVRLRSHDLNMLQNKDAGLGFGYGQKRELGRAVVV